jgi:hypothetical protein
VSATVGVGGQGKTSLTLAEALAIATGRPLLGWTPLESVPVYYFNGEDPLEEVERRLAALMIFFGVTQEELEGRFFYASGRDTPLLIAEQDHDGVRIIKNTVNRIIAEAIALGVGVIVLDPFVSIHSVQENDNVAINRLVQQGLARIAHQTNCAVEVVHHTSKRYGAETTAEDGRGASALHAGVRSVRTLNRATKADCGALGVPTDHLARYLRLDRGKGNMAPPDKAEWYYLASIELQALRRRTGEEVIESLQVATRFQLGARAQDFSPLELEAIRFVVARRSNGLLWREDSQTGGGRWVGDALKAVIVASRGALPARTDKDGLKGMVVRLIATGVLQKIKGPDDSRQERWCVAVCEAKPDPAVDFDDAMALAGKAMEWHAAPHPAAA